MPAISEVCDFAHLALGYRQYPLPRTAICRSVRRAKLIVTASSHHESERNGGFSPHHLRSTKRLVPPAATAPPRSRAAEQRDELATPHAGHGAPSPSLRDYRIVSLPPRKPVGAWGKPELF